MTLKFIDLFAGIGGFHVALDNLGHECVFASELSTELRDLYKLNHGIDCHGDITKIDVTEIPAHDVLCAGFPCQSFSKAGNQKGMKEARGQLFDRILSILEHHKPRYFILENVRNLLTHDSGNTWEYISQKLTNIGYYFDNQILSPHHINIPQHRERVFIVGSLCKADIANMQWVEKQTYKNNVNSVLNNRIKHLKLEDEKIEALGIWQDFLNELPKDVLPCKPLWSMEFGATYPLDRDWSSMTLKDWHEFKGSYGYDLSLCDSLEEVYFHLPNYVKTQAGLPPDWKQQHMQRNRDFFDLNKSYISNGLLLRIQSLKFESWKKLEWNSMCLKRNYDDKLIQFRGSGIRIKKNDFLPSLVTVKTQIPVVGKYLRYLNPKEGAKVQSLPSNIQLPPIRSSAFRVLGNMVNVQLVENIATELLKDNTTMMKENLYDDSRRHLA